MRRMIAVAVLAMLGGCRQIIGYEVPTLIEGGGGASSTSGTGGSSAGCHAGNPCYSGPTGTAGVGICKAGTTTCKPDGTVAACVGEVTPLVESCASGKDQNCDGTVSQCTGKLRWANRFGHAGAYTLAVDGMGATVIAGSADPMANLGGGPLVNGGPVVARYDATGTPIFSQTVAVSDKVHSGMSAVAADLAGDTFLTGSLVGTIDFGGGPIKNDAIIEEVPFLAKLAPNGAQVFSKVLELGVEAGAYALAVDGTGGVVVVGYAVGSADFGGGPVGPGGGVDVFVAKYDLNGKHLASAAFGGNGDARGQSVGIDAMGNIVIVGAFQGTVNFGSTALASGGSDAFVLRLSPTMKVLYAKKLGSGVVINNPGIMGFGSNLAVAVDPPGNAIVTGSFAGPLSLDATMLLTTDDAGAKDDAFFVKIDPVGEPVWAHRFGGTASQQATSIAVDASGNVVAAGLYSGILNCGTQCTSSDVTGTNAYAMKRNGTDGTEIWMQFIGEPTTAVGSAVVAVSTLGDMSVAGSVQGPLSFGGTNLPAPSGTTDLYLAMFTR